MSQLKPPRVQVVPHESRSILLSVQKAMIRVVGDMRS